MPRPLRALAAAAATVVLAALLAAPAHAGTDPSMVGAPAVGDCLHMTLDEALSPSYTGDPMNCDHPHTALVHTVATLPARLDWDSPDTSIGKAVASACNPDLAALIGDDELQKYRSQYEDFVFFPTQAQKDAGARWFYCTISIVQDVRLADLPDKLPKLSNDMPDSIARCVNMQHRFTTCADTHRFRSTYDFYARGKASKKNVEAAAIRGCRGHLTSPKWQYSWADIAGPRFIVGCYSKTRR